MYIVKELWHGRSARDLSMRGAGRGMWRSVNQLMLVRWGAAYLTISDSEWRHLCFLVLIFHFIWKYPSVIFYDVVAMLHVFFETSNILCINSYHGILRLKVETGPSRPKYLKDPDSELSSKGTRFGPISNSGLRPCLGPFTCIWITFGLRPGRLRSIPKDHNTWIAPWYLGVLFFYVSIIVSSQLVIITVPLGWFPMDPFGPWSLQVQTVIFVASILSDASRPS